MAIAIIEAWLKDYNRTYEQGKLLYDQFGDCPLKKAIFRGGSGKSAYHFNRLQDELKKISQQHQPEQKPVFTPPVNHPALKTSAIPAPAIASPAQIGIPQNIYSVPDKQWNSYPDRIKAIYAENKQLHTHSQLLFNQSRMTESAEERGPLDLQILAERRKINENWAIIKKFHESGLVTEEIKKKAQKSVSEMSVTEMAKQLKNIPTYITKSRAKLENITDAVKREKEEQKVQAWEEQLVLIKSRLEGSK